MDVKGVHIKAPLFLACVYEIGIKDGKASTNAPVKDFAEMVSEAARDIPSFVTAYNTIQHTIKSWRTYVGNTAFFDRTVHLFSIAPGSVLPQYKKGYKASIETLNMVAQCLQAR